MIASTNGNTVKQFFIKIKFSRNIIWNASNTSLFETHKNPIFFPSAKIKCTEVNYNVCSQIWPIKCLIKFSKKCFTFQSEFLVLLFLITTVLKPCISHLTSNFTFAILCEYQESLSITSKFVNLGIVSYPFILCVHIFKHGTWRVYTRNNTILVVYLSIEWRFI